MTDQKSLDKYLEPSPERNDLDYLAWKKKKIEKGLRQSKAGNVIPAAKVWADLGLED
ncbi:MAG: hypothetical protein AAF228_08455 [Pseudomonadota bacterium]